ncbi:MAG TPA: endo-1,4-beta-xylanase [Solirubrobacteraceae bacterium]|nr:endo-1,4-beta-xylanase [Solirubrobacteraceae bacterium]
MAVLLLVVVAAATLARQGRNAKPLPGQTLRALGTQRGILVGTAVRGDVLKGNRAYRQLVAQQFSTVTPENEMKWYATEPSRGKFDFGPGDAIVAAAQGAGQAIRGHTLVWYSQLPPWVDGLDRADLAAAMREHIQRMVGHYAGRVGVWDVVNEAITDGGALRRSVFLRRLGPGYIATAFRLAHAADPKAKLYINEIGAESIGPKSDRLLAVVRGLKAAGVPIDGVGFQMHSNLAGVPADFVANAQRFEALGLDVAITEADVGLKLPVTPAQLTAQAAVYTTIVRDCLKVKCVALTFWGFTDGRSWISETEPGMGGADLLDAALRPKPAFGAVQQALAGG